MRSGLANNALVLGLLHVVGVIVASLAHRDNRSKPWSRAASVLSTKTEAGLELLDCERTQGNDR